MQLFECDNCGNVVVPSGMRKNPPECDGCDEPMDFHGEFTETQMRNYLKNKYGYTEEVIDEMIGSA